MRRHARDLTARARERIRAAREHDPHAWHHSGDEEPEPIDFVSFPEYDEAGDEAQRDARPDGGATQPPLGSPEPGAAELDGAVAPGGVSGPPARRSPEGAPPRRPAPR